jgi:hypothetical protein
MFKMRAVRISVLLAAPMIGVTIGACFAETNPPCLEDLKSEMRRLLGLADQCGGSHGVIAAIESLETNQR